MSSSLSAGNHWTMVRYNVYVRLQDLLFFFLVLGIYNIYMNYCFCSCHPKIIFSHYGIYQLLGNEIIRSYYMQWHCCRVSLRHLVLAINVKSYCK
jgi:hypothetical protein